MTDPARRRSSSRSLPGSVGRYELLMPIASGGMATVYLARATGMAGFEREVAVKLTHDHLRAEPKFTTSLIDEARFAGRIRHPNVVSVLDVSECRQGVFIVMDYVEGQSLAGIQTALRGQLMPLDVVLKILDEILAGLHAAHELRDPTGAPLDLVHRDVTPHNVLIGIDGVTRLTDFGIAKAAGRLTTTQTGLVKGKLAYMAPEQARAQPLDRRCDVWAVGIIAWELMSGRRIHEGLEDAALLLKIVREAPTPLRHVRPDLPAELDRAVAGALTLDASQRYPTAEAFAEVLLAAGRSAGIPPADVRRVRDFVVPVVEPALAERRRKLAKRYARASSDRASQSDLDSSLVEASDPSLPSAQALEAEDGSSGPTDPTVYSGPANVSSGLPDPTFFGSPAAAASSTQAQTGSLNAGMELPDGSRRQSQIPRLGPRELLKRHPALLLSLLVGALVAAAATAVGVLRSARTSAETEPPGISKPARPPLEKPPAALAGPAVAPDASPSAAPDIPVFDLSGLPPAPPAASGAATRAEPPAAATTAPKTRRPTPPAPKADPNQPNPLDNPYPGGGR